MTFIESIYLLLLTAALTTFLIPLLFRFIDSSRRKREVSEEHQRGLAKMRYEAELARQAKVIDAQDSLLDEITKQLWRFRYLAMSVSYYEQGYNDGRYDEAVSAYDRESWNSFNRVRESISRSRRLVSEGAYAKLVQFYETELVPFDRDRVRRVIETRIGFGELNEYIFEILSGRIDDLIYSLSEDIQLVRQ